ncbi:MAG: chromosomal replication initiator protein DnaA [Clostridia bacterium]|nr:chromosomal replication initiator protein DnaA [Clostridia bacterium]
MNKTEFNKNWLKVMNLLYEKIDKIKVDTFFNPLSPSKISEKEKKIYLISSMGNASFYQSRVNTYKRDLDDAITEVFGKPYEVVLCEKEPNIPEEETIEEDPYAADELYLNPQYTFENFVAGNENQFPLAACLAVADGYSKVYNPLFLYGGSGLGKTHLMHAIGNYVSKNSPKKKILYVSSESFTNELIMAIQTKSQNQFKNKYRSIDYLLFDDVQFIAGRKSVEEELFNTFDILHNKGKQIVFTSDKAPAELGDFPERLSTRFSWGMVAEVKEPEYESRMAILRNKAIMADFDMNNKKLVQALDMIAQNCEGNVRELEGAFKRVVAHAALINEEISPELVKKVLTDLFKTKEKEVTPDNIKKAVSEYFGIKISELESSSRSRNIAYPRQIAIYLIRENTNNSLPQIGKYFGGRDHTTILHSYEKIKSELTTSKDLKNTIDNITAMINS